MRLILAAAGSRGAVQPISYPSKTAMTSSVIVTRAFEATDELLAACYRLVPQLTGLNPPPSRLELAEMLASPCSILFIARDTEQVNQEGGEIVGMATLILYRVPTGLRGYIEDVVVDEKIRGMHIGEALTHACLEYARQAGAQQVGLTSNPNRAAANRLYQRMGFVLRTTNTYKYDLRE